MKFFLIFFAAALINACSLLPRAPQVTLSVNERLAMFPKNLKSHLRSDNSFVTWNDHLVPYIESDRDEDAAFLLGVTHYYLRAFQLELLRRVAQGRVSESAGPFTRDLDQTLRLFNFGKRAGEILDAMNPEARNWIENYVRGLNVAQEQTAEPFEFSALAIKKEVWTSRELLAVTRVLAADVNWFTWISSLRDKNPLSVWQKNQLAQIEDLFQSLSKSGSNTWVIGPELSQNRKGYIANDPHVGIIYPNLWILAGVDSPSIQAAGFMLPAVPFVLLGRNKDLGWGGTNMRGLSTEFYDLSKMDSKNFSEREEIIKTRFWFDRTIKIRESPWGPVLSDSPFFKKSGLVFSVKWMGHELSDEMGTFYLMNKARDASEFRQAFKNYAVSAQNFLFIDRKGNIGHVLATRQPVRNFERAAYGPLLEPEKRFVWESFQSPLELEHLLNPALGFLASANNKPLFSKTELGLFFAPPDRSQRIADLISEKKIGGQKISLADSILWQTDTFSHNAFKIKNYIVENFYHSETPPLLKRLENWNGFFDRDSEGALTYACLEAQIIKELELKIENQGQARELLLKEETLKALDAEKWRVISQSCLKGDLKRFKNWGEKHRLKFSHPFSNLPLVGGAYVFLDRAESGSFDSLSKRAHSLSAGATPTTYGATARHISDMADPDANYFALFGGQDGWVKSLAGTSQIPLWDESRYLTIPLSRAKRAELFPFKSQFE